MINGNLSHNLQPTTLNCSVSTADYRRQATDDLITLIIRHPSSIIHISTTISDDSFADRGEVTAGGINNVRCRLQRNTDTGGNCGLRTRLVDENRYSGIHNSKIGQTSQLRLYSIKPTPATTRPFRLMLMGL